jgi:hypothetical protein
VKFHGQRDVANLISTFFANFRLERPPLPPQRENGGGKKVKIEGVQSINNYSNQ